MSEIDWSKAPHWADRVIEGGASNLMYWASDNTLQLVKGCASFVTDTHIRNGLPVVERRPAPITIEQRIVSLRALGKRVEETRAELTRDLEALGLTWMVRGDPEQPTITDWRDLRVGDVVGFDGLDGEYTVCDLETTGYNGCEPIKVVEDIPMPCRYTRWPDVSDHQWRFIRRP